MHTNSLKFEVFRASNKQWTWHFKAGNGRIIAYAGETYVNKTDAYQGINLVKQYAPAAQIYELNNA